MPTKQSCRTCKHLFVQPDKDGKVRFRKLTIGRCKAPIPPMPENMPESVTMSFRRKWPEEWTKSFMQPHQGKTCGAWEKRDG